MTRSRLKVYLAQLEVKNDHQCLINVAKLGTAGLWWRFQLCCRLQRAGEGMLAPGSRAAPGAGIGSSVSVWKPQQQENRAACTPSRPLTGTGLAPPGFPAQPSAPLGCSLQLFQPSASNELPSPEAMATETTGCLSKTNTVMPTRN